MTIPTILSLIFVALTLIDVLATNTTYGEHIKDTPKNREFIKKIMLDPKNGFCNRRNILHVYFGSGREHILYVTKIRSIVAYYDLQGMGWVSRFSPLKKFIDTLYNQRLSEYKEQSDIDL